MNERLIRPIEIDRIPSIFCQNETIVPVNVNILINDINLVSSQQEVLQELSKKQLLFIEPDQLSGILSQQLVNALPVLTGKKVAVLYPLQGGVTVKDSLNIDNIFDNQVDFQEFEIESTRYEPNSSPNVSLPEILINQLNKKTLNNILVVDDVIVTGSTMEQIKTQVYKETDEVNYSEYDPNIRFSYDEIQRTRLPINWYAASWLTYAKPKVQVKTLSAFKQIYTGVYYKGEKGQTPVNSLSTWLYDENKGQKVLLNYANKYTNNPIDFINYINSLQI